HADTARNALATGFMAEEAGDAQENLVQVDGVIEEHDDTGTQGGADGARAFKGEWSIQLLWSDESARSSAEQHGLKIAAAGNASGKVDELVEGGAHGNFIDAGPRDVPAKTKEARSRGILCAELSVSGAALQDDSGDVNEC